MRAVDDLETWLRQQLENQRHTADALKALAHALPAETGAYLTETADMLLADVDAKRRILDQCADVWAHDRVEAFAEDVLRLLALPYAGRPGYRGEWRP